MKVTGIILAGGKGIRLGRNKGMARLNGRHLIEYVIDNLQACCDEVLISSNSDQCREFGLPVVADIYPAKGPMAGIHACLSASSNVHNVVISVDTPFAGPEFIHYLLENREDALIAAPWYEKDHYEPLCAYYNQGAVPYMEEFFARGNFKLPDLFRAIPFMPLKITDDDTIFHPMLFHNINTEADLVQAEEYLKNEQ